MDSKELFKFAPLYIASKQCYLDIVKELIDYSDLPIKNDKGKNCI